MDVSEEPGRNAGLFRVRESSIIPENNCARLKFLLATGRFCAIIGHNQTPLHDRPNHHTPRRISQNRPRGIRRPIRTNRHRALARFSRWKASQPDFGREKRHNPKRRQRPSQLRCRDFQSSWNRYFLTLTTHHENTKQSSHRLRQSRICIRPGRDRNRPRRHDPNQRYRARKRRP